MNFTALLVVMQVQASMEPVAVVIKLAVIIVAEVAIAIDKSVG